MAAKLIRHHGTHADKMMQIQALRLRAAKQAAAKAAGPPVAKK